MGTVGDELEILRKLFREATDFGERLISKSSLRASGRLGELTKVVPHLVEASEVAYADFSHELHFEFLTVSGQFGGLDVASLLQLFLVSNRRLEVVELILCRLNMVYVGDLTEKMLIVQLLDGLAIRDIDLARSSLYGTVDLSLVSGLGSNSYFLWDRLRLDGSANHFLGTDSGFIGLELCCKGLVAVVLHILRKLVNEAAIETHWLHKSG